MMILITGANGQLGTEIRYLLDEKNIDYTATDINEMDITSVSSVERIFEKVKPNYVFHTAAYTAVDMAEDEGREADYQINAVGTRNVAEICEKYGAILIHISSDYIFDGTKTDGEYMPEDKPNPQSRYGYTKLLAEEAVLSVCTNYYIVRTSWVFGNYGHNFVFTMQRLAKSHQRLTIVDDQIGRPTWTRTLAEFMLHLVEKKPEYGIYQLSNDNICNWYEFAKEILKNEDVEIVPITSDEFPQKANRPKYSVMNLDKAKETGFIIPTWEEALAKMLERELLIQEKNHKDS